MDAQIYVDMCANPTPSLDALISDEGGEDGGEHDGAAK